jgi:hypothetical protein
MQLTEKILDSTCNDDRRHKPAAENYNVACIREGKSKKVYSSPVLKVYGTIHTARPCRC